jgi:uncharacterized protein YbjT (DUF2867 family)
MATVLVTGGTGTLGRAVVTRLTGKQHHTLFSVTRQCPRSLATSRLSPAIS